LENELNVEQVLRERGFSILDPGVLSVKEIATQLSGASLVAGVEGSHMSHALYLMSDTGCFINIQPPDRFNTEHKLYADWIGYRYGFVVGTQTGQGAFTVSIDDLLAVIDRASGMHANR
jgi:capsular polysaccharide biosynthesis protein